ncbi:NAD(P)-dependent oxidoreductase [Mycobacterium genavense]|uniref:NAD(P)-dependent oxidoreductase n=1 Tax=Mycobacterium genavense TaxID=36812 RepID=UPI0004B74DB1|nr:NAD-binding protein [Mycobacterium genavense]
MTEQLRTVVIGLGSVGVSISQQLMRAGNLSVAVDADANGTALAAGYGIPVARSLAYNCDTGPIAISALPSVEALNSLCTQLVKGTSGIRYLVEASAVPVAAKSRARVFLEAVGITMMDCAIIETNPSSYRRDVVACASGPQGTVEAVRPVLGAFSQRVEYVGEFGAATAIRLVGNLIVALNNATTAEALTLAQRLDLNSEVMVELLAGTAARSGQLELQGPMMASGNYAPASATLGMFIKEVDLISELAGAAGSPTPLLNTAAVLYRAAGSALDHDLDGSAIHAIYEPLPPIK